VLSTERKIKEIQAIADEVSSLTASSLYAYRVKNKYHPVIGEGDVDAELMFIGEAPGASEAKSGRPFVGASGRVLAELLESIGLRREGVYITNIVKDRPPENRDPSVEDIRLYSPFLLRQIQAIQPKVIATLGRFSMDFILEQLGSPQAGKKISQLHGTPIPAEADYGPVTVVPLFHPAVALYNLGQRQTLEEDFKVLGQFVQKK
jgi:DNA polymerase